MRILLTHGFVVAVSLFMGTEGYSQDSDGKVVKVYDLAPLAVEQQGRRQPQQDSMYEQGYGGESSRRGTMLDAVNTVLATAKEGSAAVLGGRRLVVRATPDVHQSVADLLDRLANPARMVVTVHWVFVKQSVYSRSVLANETAAQLLNRVGEQSAFRIQRFARADAPVLLTTGEFQLETEEATAVVSGDKGTIDPVIAFRNSGFSVRLTARRLTGARIALDVSSEAMTGASQAKRVQVVPSDGHSAFGRSLELPVKPRSQTQTTVIVEDGKPSLVSAVTVDPKLTNRERHVLCLIVTASSADRESGNEKVSSP